MLVSSKVDKTFKTRRSTKVHSGARDVADILKLLNRSSTIDPSPSDISDPNPDNDVKEPPSPSPTPRQQKVSQMVGSPDVTDNRQHTEKQARMKQARAARAQRSTRAAQQLEKNLRGAATLKNADTKDDDKAQSSPVEETGRKSSSAVSAYDRNNRRSIKLQQDLTAAKSPTSPPSDHSAASDKHDGDDDDGYMEVLSQREPELVLQEEDLNDEIVQEALLLTLQQRKEKRMKEHVALWLEEQAIPAAMDDKCVPVMNLLQWVHETEIHSKTGRQASADETKWSAKGERRSRHSRQTCVCFCGPAALGRMLQEGVYNLEYDIAFYSETQAN
eukprot:m.1419501 g.1419501  ORF g.1419501 m.1419501 type:complete len:331 (-) comp25040_c1_seq2:207-1199(-)